LKKVFALALIVLIAAVLAVSTRNARAPYKPGYGTVIVDKQGAAEWIRSISSVTVDDSGEAYIDLWEAEELAESLFGAKVPGVWSTSHSAKGHQFIPYDECIDSHKVMVDEWLLGH
jgi:hypothetical protein